MAGLRDVIIDEYFGIDTETIWDVVKNQLPELKKAYRKAEGTNNETAFLYVISATFSSSI
ncbi:MAG: DUF86 domain-containing protein [Chitinispirillaceae bacterium]|nr:DUF86 domain-containing protein [Chitinispirillaceae bacterium]